MAQNILGYICKAAVRRKFFIEAVFSLNENAQNFIYFPKNAMI